MVDKASNSVSFWTALAAGGVAGTAVDVVLFPLDTVKTRMQSANGFWRSGGFKGIYSGLLPAASGSAPTAALFFGTYENTKKFLFASQLVQSGYLSYQSHLIHMIAGSFGEIVACLVRVPTENLKQKMQAKLYNSLGDTIRGIVSQQGLKGFFTGYGTTVMREIPFATIQYPVWEFTKKLWAQYQNRPVSPFQAALCGSFAGGVAAFFTTPLDVVKTRLMLGADAKGNKYNGMLDTFSRVYRHEGFATFFSGIGPRVMWISIGGSVFFGAYETGKLFFSKYI